MSQIHVEQIETDFEEYARKHGFKLADVIPRQTIISLLRPEYQIDSEQNELQAELAHTVLQVVSAYLLKEENPRHTEGFDAKYFLLISYIGFMQDVPQTDWSLKNWAERNDSQR